MNKERIRQQASIEQLNMKLSQTDVKEIRAAFHRMQTTDDFVELINTTKKKLYGSKAYPVDWELINYYSNEKYRETLAEEWRKSLPEVENSIQNIVFSSSIYRSFEISKKDGNKRLIHAPIRGLKNTQQVIAQILQCVFEPHKAAYGFTRNKSVADNAKLHVGKRYVFNLDLKDFFPSIEQARVRKCLELAPFNLNERSSNDFRWETLENFKTDILQVKEALKLGRFHNGRLAIVIGGLIIYAAKNIDLGKPLYIVLADESIKSRRNENLKDTLWLVNKVPSTGRLKIANIIVNMCCLNMEVERKDANGQWYKINRRVLPQGAPTSPILTNIVCQRLDQLLTGAAKRFGLNYSRYADDITFSSMHNVYQSGSDFLIELNRIITDQGFHIKESKTRLQKEGFRQEVTGIVVNEKVNVQRWYIKQLRLWLYYWERYGFERAYKFFLQHYEADKGHLKKGKPDMIKVIAGKLDYLRMVKGFDNTAYAKLNQRFILLTNSNRNSISKNNRNEFLSAVITLLLNEGIEVAMKKYNEKQNK